MSRTCEGLHSRSVEADVDQTSFHIVCISFITNYAGQQWNLAIEYLKIQVCSLRYFIMTSIIKIIFFDEYCIKEKHVFKSDNNKKY